MLTKGFKQLLAEANAAVDTLSAEAAVEIMDDADAVFVDVREAAERTQGFIPGSVHAARGFLEFIADPEGPMHDPAFRPTSGSSSTAARAGARCWRPRRSTTWVFPGSARWAAASRPG